MNVFRRAGAVLSAAVLAMASPGCADGDATAPENTGPVRADTEERGDASVPEAPPPSAKEVPAPVFVDISAGQKAGSGRGASPLIDTVNGKLLVVVRNAANQGKPGLFRCNLDGTSCTYVDIPSAEGSDTGFFSPMPAAIDTVNQKLVVVAWQRTSKALHLIRCKLDGTACASSNITGARKTGCDAALLVDDANKKILVAAGSGDVSGVPTNLSLYRCGLDGTGCVASTISTLPSAGDTVEMAPSMMMDAVHKKLLVVAERIDGSALKGTLPILYRCNVDGTGCSYVDISAGQRHYDGGGRYTALDGDPPKLLVVATGQTTRAPVLNRCDGTGKGCSVIDISAGAIQSGANDSMLLSLVIDPMNKQLLAVGQNVRNHNTLSLFRCALDGEGCKHFDISAGQGAESGEDAIAVIDAVHRKLLVVTTSHARSYRPSLFIVDLDYVAQ